MAEQSSPNYKAFLGYADSLFRFALTLTSTKEEATRLVTATYERLQLLSDTDDSPCDRAWLFALLRQIHLEKLTVTDIDSHLHAPLMVDLRKQLLDRFFHHAIPELFLSLPADDRSLLMLADEQGLSAGEIARVLETSEQEVSVRLGEVRSLFVRDLNRAAGPFQRILLSTLPDRPSEWLPDALIASLDPILPAFPASALPRLARQPVALDAPKPFQVSTKNSAGRRSNMHRHKRFFGAVAMIVMTGLIGYVIATYLPHPEVDTNLISLAVRNAESAEFDFRTKSFEQGERYLYDRLDWRLTIPSIDGATLDGVGHSAFQNGSSSPVLFYTDDETDVPITVFAFDYAYLDRNQDRVHLERSVLQQIQDDQHFDLYVMDDVQVLIWRNQDDIFVGVYEGDANALRERIQFPF